MDIKFSAMTEADRTAAFSALDDTALSAAITQINTEAQAIFALDAPTVEQAAEVQVLAASVTLAKAEADRRDAEAAEMQKQFDAARAVFAVNDGVETGAEDETEDEAEETEEGDGSETSEDETEDETEEGDETVEAAKGENPFDKKRKKVAEDETEDEKKVVTASASRRLKGGSTASRVGRQTKRPARRTSSPVTITAAADVPNVATGSALNDLGAVSKALVSRVANFPKFNLAGASKVAEASGGEPVLNKVGVASFGLSFEDALTASGSHGQEYGSVKEAIQRHAEVQEKALEMDETITAAGWCAPSEVAYNYLADYVVDGLATYPSVNAPRGGIMSTTGPALAEQYAQNGSDFGWTQTEAQAIARTVKPCETIICPEFEDHRLDAVGYCWKIPILTKKAYPELVTDALRLSAVLYAHKMNARFIADAVALSTSVTASGLGASFTDTLEALTIIAVKERRRLNLGENKVMEVKMPVWAKEVFRADISRRAWGQTGPVTDQQINAEFTSRRLAPEYVTDWADLTGANPVFAASFPVMIYPAGTFVKAVEDVISLQGVYDAASLSVNEYTGVFYEQGVMLFQAGYKSTVFDVPVCTAGLVGAPILDCHPESANWAGQKAAVVA